VRAILYAKVSGIQYVDIKGSYVQIDATTRRFYGGAQLGPTFLTNALDYVLLETTGWAGRTAVVRATGYVFALSDQQIGPVEWADFDPYKVANHEGRIGALEGVSLPSCKTMAVNGNLPSGATSTGSWVAGGASIQALVDSFLNPLGVSYAYVESSLAAVEQVYYQFRPVTGRVWKNGAYLSYSFIVIADSWAWLDDAAGRIRVLIYPLGGGGQGQQHAPTTYEAISASMRRYNGTVQLAMNPYGTDLDFVWQSIVVPAGRTTIVKATAFAYALGDTDPGPLDWKDWDPWQVNSHASRINALELVVPTPAQMADPLLLIPSSYHLVQGRPLTLYKHGLSETRERNPYEIEFVGANAGGDQAFIEYVQRQINLDGARLSGNGAVYGRIGDDEDTIFKRPLTFYSSPAAKTGSPKILTIGDSLTYRGTLSRMAAKLTAAGVTPTYIGTVQDVGGVLGEGRPSWEFSDYTRRHLVVNSDGTAPSYPVDAAGGDGIVTTVAQYLALSESLGTSYAARWQYNPFIRPSVGGDPADFSKNGYIFDMRFYLDRFSLADPDIVLVALGTNDTASNPGHSGDATGTPLVNITEGLNIMYTQIRAALPDAHVGIVLNGFPGRALWGKFLPALKYILQTYGGREAENIWLLPVYSAQDTKTLYGITVSATDDLGTQKGALLDWVHTDAIGMAQWAEMTFAFVMNRL
jgi:lysophospholipase L1-like esterase